MTDFDDDIPAEPVPYTINCRLGGQVDFDPEMGDVGGLELARSIARDRLWEELTELVLRGTQADFEAAFEVQIGDEG